MNEHAIIGFLLAGGVLGTVAGLVGNWLSCRRWRRAARTVTGRYARRSGR